MSCHNQESRTPGSEEEPVASGPGAPDHTNSPHDSTPTNTSNPINEATNASNTASVESSNGASATPAPTPFEPAEGPARLAVNIFDRLLDTILQRTRRSPSEPPLSRGSTSTASSGAPISSSSGGTSGAIIITVNYVFSDENNPTNPNRTGSLVMSLPNNASNRDPRVIQEFIRLATQMAYSTLVSGLHKQTGITVDKFNSFPIKDGLELAGNNDCSICFEHFEPLNAKKRAAPGGDDSDASDADENAVKKRKTNDNTPSVTETARPGPPSDAKFLSGLKADFLHVPVQMPCGHIFGKSCLYEWLKNHSSCPLCRGSVAEGAQTSSLPGNGAPTTTTTTTTTTSSNMFSPAASGLSVFDAIQSSPDAFTNGQLPPNIRVVNRPSRYRGLVSDNGSGGIQNILRNEHINDLVDSGTPAENISTEGPVFPGVLPLLTRPSSEEDLLFPTGVSSRRTASGIETRSTEDSDHENVLDFMNLRSLVDDDAPAAGAPTSDTPANASVNAASNHEASNDAAADNDQRD